MNIAICRLMGLALGPQLPPLDIIRVVKIIMVIDNDIVMMLYAHSIKTSMSCNPSLSQRGQFQQLGSISDENGHHVKVIKATGTKASTEAPASRIVEKIASNEQHPLEASNGRRNRL